MFLVALVAGLAVVIGVVVLTLRSRPKPAAPLALPDPQIPTFTPGAPAGPRLDPVQAWQAAAPSLVALGMTQLEAELYVRRFDDGERREVAGTALKGAKLFLSLKPRDATLRGWFERAAPPGGALDRHLGEKAQLGPREAGQSDLARWVAGAVGELLGGLPDGARLKVKAPELPGASYETNLTTPFTTPDAPALVVRTLLAFDEAAHRPASGGAPVQLPPLVQCWVDAAPALDALGLTKVDARTYTREADKGLFVKLEVAHAGVHGWIDRPCPGGALEQHFGVEDVLGPGDDGRSPLAWWVADAVRALLRALPPDAKLRVKAPEIPGDGYEAHLETPMSTPEHAAIVARVLIALDEAAQKPAVSGAPGQLPPAAVCWQAAAPSLEALGMKRFDAKNFTRDVGGRTATEMLYLSLQVREATLNGMLERPCPGGVLERLARAEIELQPGQQGQSELGMWLTRAVGELLGALPRDARLTVKAPDMPGASYKARLATPFTAPSQAEAVVRVLLALDEAAAAAA